MFAVKKIAISYLLFSNFSYFLPTIFQLCFREPQRRDNSIAYSSQGEQYHCLGDSDRYIFVCVFYCLLPQYVITISFNPLLESPGGIYVLKKKL